MDQTRSSVEEQTVIIQLICRCSSYGLGVTLIPPEDDSLIGASTTTSHSEASRSEVLIEVGVSLTAIDSRAVLTGVLGSLRSQLRSSVLRPLELEECGLRIVVGTEVVVRNRGDPVEGNILVHVVAEGHQEERPLRLQLAGSSRDWDELSTSSLHRDRRRGIEDRQVDRSRGSRREADLLHHRSDLEALRRSIVARTTGIDRDRTVRGAQSISHSLR